MYSGSARFNFMRCKISLGMLYGLVALLESRLFIIFIISIGFVGLIKKLCSFALVKYSEKSVRW